MVAWLKSIYKEFTGSTIIQDDYHKRKSTKSDKYRAAVAWMNDYFSKIGEKMPHLNQVSTYMIIWHSNTSILFQAFPKMVS